MNKLWIPAAVLSLSATAAAQTDMIAASRPACNISIVAPKNSAGHYFSRDCRAAFVLPPTRGTVKVERVNTLSNLRLCPALNQAYARHARYAELQERLMTRLGDTGLSAQQREDLRQDANVLGKAIDDLYKNLDGVPGAVAQVSYTMPQSAEWIGNYITLNPNLGADYRLKFHPATIAEGLLVISAVDDKNKNIPLNPVVRANLPGMLPEAANQNRLSGTGILSNGNTSGQLTLSLTGACEYEEKGRTNMQDLVVHMVANFTYAVPVQSVAGYKARLDTDTAIKNWAQSWQTRSHMSKSEGATLVSIGSAGEAFSLSIEEYPNNMTEPTDRAGFYSALRGEVLTRLSARLVDQMVVAGFLAMSQPVQPANAADPGYLEEVRTRRECSHNSGFLGIGAKTRCADIPYSIKIPYATSADAFLEKVNNTSFKNEESVSINTIIHHPHTSTFLPEE